MILAVRIGFSVIAASAVTMVAEHVHPMVAIGVYFAIDGLIEANT